MLSISKWLVKVSYGLCTCAMQWMHCRTELRPFCHMQTWREDTAKFTRLQDLHAWLHSTHLCYSVLRQVGVRGP